MSFTSLLKLATLPALALALTLSLLGCNATNNNSLTLTQGNWSMAAASSQGGGTFYVGGNLTQSGANISGAMYAVKSLCFDPSEKQTFSGTVKGTQVTLTSTPDSKGQVITVVASGTSGSALSGSYSVTGGTCANGDHGTANANAVPSISGTWNGSVVIPTYDPSATVSIALTQASSASADGTFALTGTLTFNNSLCEASGTISSGSTFGPSVGFTATTVAGDTIYYTGGILDSTMTPKNITTGTYSVAGGACDGQTANPNPTFTKQ